MPYVPRAPVGAAAAAAGPSSAAVALPLASAHHPSATPPRRLLLGYAYPAYKTFKVVQLPATRSNDTLLRHWCQFW